MSEAPTDPLLQLVFHGESLAGHDALAVRRAVIQALKLDEPRAARLFSGQRVVLRRGLDAATAHRHVVRFAVMGAVLHAEPSRPRSAGAATREQLPTALQRRSRPTWWRPLRKTGQRVILTVLGVAFGVAMGLLLGPGLNALWPDDPVAGSGAALPAGVPPAGTAAPVAMVSELPAPEPLSSTSSVPGSAPGAAAGLPPKAGNDAPQDITPAALAEHQQRYLVSPQHKAFAITAGGAHGWHAGALSEDDARSRALAACLAALGSGNGSCRIVDVDGSWE